MSIHEEIDSLTNRIQEFDDRSSELGHQAWELRRQRELLFARLILEDGLLKDTTWDVELDTGYHPSNTVYLNYTGPITDKSTPIGKIIDMARNDYHSNFSLMENVNIRFDDNNISLHFKESKALLPFITKYGLVINGTSIRDRLAKLKREVSALELVCHQFKL